jgi:hypothetical protein
MKVFKDVAALKNLKMTLQVEHFFCEKPEVPEEPEVFEIFFEKKNL